MEGAEWSGRTDQWAEPRACSEEREAGRGGADGSIDRIAEPEGDRGVGVQAVARCGATWVFAVGCGGRHRFVQDDQRYLWAPRGGHRDQDICGFIEAVHALFGYLRAAGRGRVSAGDDAGGSRAYRNDGESFSGTVRGAFLSFSGAERERDRQLRDRRMLQ